MIARPGKGGIGDAIPLVGKSFATNKLDGGHANRPELFNASKNSGRSHGKYAASSSLGYRSAGGPQGQGRGGQHATPNHTQEYHAAFQLPGYAPLVSAVESGSRSAARYVEKWWALSWDWRRRIIGAA